MAERHDVIDPLLIGMSQLGGRLFRNNSGVAWHRDGTAVRYGVGLGGSDTIGWLPVVITPGMVGKTLAVFCAVEAKTGKQKPNAEQSKFLSVVADHGGLALWGNNPDVLLVQIKAWRERLRE